VQRIYNCDKIQNNIIVIHDKVINVVYMDHSASIKSNTLENTHSGRNKKMWTVNNGRNVIFSFTRLVQSMFNCDKIQDNNLTPDKVLNSLIYGSHFIIIILYLYIYIYYYMYVIRRPALMELFLLVSFHCISSCFNYCFVSYCGK